MKKFKYKAVNLYGKKFSGTFLAESEQDLREQLAIQNLYLVSAKTTGDRTPNAFFSVSGKVGVAEMSAFCRQFAIMLSSGTAITDALDILSGQDFSKYFCKTLSLVCADVKSGLLLSEALSKHKRIFPDILRSMVRVGEVSGSLDAVMSSVADYFEADSKLKATVKSAMAYPAVLILMAIGIVLLLVLFVIPTFMDTFSSIDVQMPKITVALYSFSRWVSSYWEFIVIAVVAVAAAWILFLRTKRGRYAWDKCKFHMPFIGKIIKYNISARFCRAFSLLVSGGMDIVDALDETALA
ncbi:MAG: type II secretion system F family protein, partial [Clostridia bacterium]|nr:type II secretion system F family protein [Clostridia bacterium]